jgi:zinc transport system substrate-binding protein
MIYHPAYTYYARDYGIEQIAIEHDGKEPTPKQLTALCNEGERLGIDVIFHQPQYSADKLRSIAEELGAEVIMTDPLSFDIESEIRRVVDIIAKQNE